MQYKTTLVILFIFPIMLMAQKPKAWNKPLYDAYPYHFGFSFTAGMLDFSVNPSDILAANPTVMSVEGTPGPIFGASMVSNLKLTNDLDLRFIPGLHFGQRKLTYRYIYTDNIKTDTLNYTMKIESTLLQFPLILKYRATRENNYRPYVIFGANYCLDLATRKAVPDDGQDETPDYIKLNKQDVLVEVGVGVDSYLPYFKFSTELKFSYGLLNMVNYDGRAYTDVFDRLGTKMLTLSIYFE